MLIKLAEFYGWLLVLYLEAEKKEAKYKRSKEYWRVRKLVLAEVTNEFKAKFGGKK